MRMFLTICITMLLSIRSDSPVATLADAKEPGTRLVVHGRLFDPSGKKPVAGAKLVAWHTDAKGHYGRIAGIARLKGTVTTDAQGRFELRTIRPAPYPNGSNPAHIHFEAWGAGYRKQPTAALEFTDDPHVTPRMLAESRAKGMFASIVTTSRDAKGVLHATINLRLTEK